MNDNDNLLDPGPMSLAKPPAGGLATSGRYDGVKSRKFANLCAEASKGGKYQLDDELGIIKGLLASLIQGLENPVDTQDLATKLIKADFDKDSAAYISNCVSQYASPKQMATVLKELRETLKLAATLEGMCPILQVREWARAFMRIVREEVKDDIIVGRIRTRAGSEPV